MSSIYIFTGNWLKRSSLSGLTDGVEDLLDISSVDRLSFIRQSSKVRSWSLIVAFQMPQISFVAHPCARLCFRLSSPVL